MVCSESRTILQNVVLINGAMVFVIKWVGRRKVFQTFAGFTIFVLIKIHIFFLILYRKFFLRRFLPTILGFLVSALDTQQVQPLF